MNAAVPRFALTRKEAAASIGASVDWFEQNVQPSLKLVRRGRKILVPCAELQRWVSDEAERVLGGGR